MLADGLQRAQAIDPHASFIVQAPAGSGKTEILAQRYLRLLSGVQAPEEIVALTFTRKAANEMRERILMALQDAANNTPVHSNHQQQTRDLATAALQRDATCQWQLLQQPSRLRIITIDALCQLLTRAIPIQEQHVPYANIADKPEYHYKAAAQACFDFALEQSAFQEPLKILLEHVDNRQDHLLSLFSDLLAHRDQWLGLLYQAKQQDKITHEQALAWILEHELNRFKQSIPNVYSEPLVRLSRQLADVENDPTSPRYSLRHWQSLDTLDREMVGTLASLLLTSQQSLRKAFDHHVGLRRGECPDELYDELKSASKSLLNDLAELPDFLPALLRVRKLPPPYYDAEQWEVLQALFSLLPLLAAHLQVIFREQNEVDFTAVAAQALLALGDEDTPTDLALYLDNQIRHLLVDEFQDTSIQQFQLLTKLVQHWQAHEGNTLFVVGDPMQSIYRFRAAEVGLFLRAQQQGIGPVRLIPLELSCNFRSTATIVDWVNTQFQSIFPKTDDMESGAVCFHTSVSIKPAHDNSMVLAFQHSNKQTEAEALVNLIELELTTHPDDNMAILVRSRQQLIDIVRCLRTRQIAFQGVDIALLASLPHLRDIWSLTEALLMPGNRLAWLALLRSPWCGLNLADLYVIANYSKDKSIYFALSKLEHIADLSDEGQQRAQFIFKVLDDALAQRHQRPLIQWLTHILQQLQIEKILTKQEQEDVEQFWQLLEQFERQGQLEDMAQFHKEFNKLYSQQAVPARLQIMTIHKSKGLEFDTVFLPGLGTRPPQLDTPMLRWLQLPSQQHGELLLLSPIKAAHHENCLLYDYLGKLDSQKNDYEIQRLLYVAVTRAKKRLYLFDNNETVSQGTFRHLLREQTFITTESSASIQQKEHPLYPMLYRLPIEHYAYDESTTPYIGNNPAPVISHSAPRLIGIVAHELLQWICDHHPRTISDIPWTLAHHQLRSLGFNETILQEAQNLIQKQITAFFHDPIGQWLMKTHEDERNEYELLVEDIHGPTTKIIDRTFCEQGRRWIIDFKTGQNDQSTQAKHREQVDAYAQLFSDRTTKQSIHCGLYYLETQQWVTWEYQ